jgi:hypothetical protein
MLSMLLLLLQPGECFDWISAHSNGGVTYVNAYSEACSNQPQLINQDMTHLGLNAEWIRLHDLGYMIRSLSAYGGELVGSRLVDWTER